MQVRVIDYTSKTAPQDFAAALKEIGFAVISNHPLDNSLITKVYAEWEKFFNSEDKYNYAFDKQKHDGYISKEMSETAKGYKEKDLKEFYHYYFKGRCPPYLRPITDNLASSMSVLAAELLSWLQENTPKEIIDKLSMPLSDMIKDTERTLFRMINYPPLTGNEPKGALRAAAHEDINLLTVLPAATAKGLQVKDTNGNWLEVPCDPSWIVINAGDMLQECTGYYYPSTSHRVINPVGEEAKKPRLSMPLFLHPVNSVRLSERHTAGSYFAERMAELGLV